MLEFTEPCLGGVPHVSRQTLEDGRFFLEVQRLGLALDAVLADFVVEEAAAYF